MPRKKKIVRKKVELEPEEKVNDIENDGFAYDENDPYGLRHKE